MTDDRPDGRFPTTRSSRVVAAADPDRPEARAALAEPCAAYWFPVYAVVRRKGHDPDAALDVTQMFFTSLVVNWAGGPFPPIAHAGPAHAARLAPARSPTRPPERPARHRCPRSGRLSGSPVRACSRGDEVHFVAD
jgi:hypothetical protein